MQKDGEMSRIEILDIKSTKNEQKVKKKVKSFYALEICNSFTFP